MPRSARELPLGRDRVADRRAARSGRAPARGPPTASVAVALIGPASYCIRDRWSRPQSRTVSVARPELSRFARNGIDHLPPVCIHWLAMTAFDQLGTEARDAGGADLDLRSTAELVELMNAEDATVPAAVAEPPRARSPPWSTTSPPGWRGRSTGLRRRRDVRAARRARRGRVRGDLLGRAGPRDRAGRRRRCVVDARAGGGRGRRRRRPRRRRTRSPSGLPMPWSAISASGRSPYVRGGARGGPRPRSAHRLRRLRRGLRARRASPSARSACRSGPRCWPARPG